MHGSTGFLKVLVAVSIHKRDRLLDVDMLGAFNRSAREIRRQPQTVCLADWMGMGGGGGCINLNGQFQASCHGQNSNVCLCVFCVCVCVCVWCVCVCVWSQSKVSPGHSEGYLSLFLLPTCTHTRPDRHTCIKHTHKS